ncbi:Chromosome (plasmid) partitioning protein ParB [Candidatus Syntrophocurvum alkaliphilum]|uniref:Chromosome (Plasmid) partitioning protein ParB n=1 Tax=Candidatus Syntrophocurvum alkaliphilum TaxID=2293317 RepID=A0A6I6DL72_9FIRM|nr:nucleoid occlusion protein [Candidatus Syntrophocurvum alkaliphilum]QGU00617.1 Chromosome (plasmid) partitioning protein ParB [Candidatus Syntrophocurvum alkaliphilum]
MVREQLKNIFGKSMTGRIVTIPIDEILKNPFQPRRVFNETELTELAQSIKEYGVIQPIIVKKLDEGYQLIAGERRLRACKIAERNEIPAIIQDINDEKAAAISLIENLQRKELSYFEEASAYSLLINDFGLKQDDLAKKIGKSQSAIANKLRLLRLPDKVRTLITTDIITERHCRALLKLNSNDMQMEVLRQIYEKDLTVKETEELVYKLKNNNIPPDPEVNNKETGKNVSMIIRDARIFLNTIKETVSRAKQTGIDISMTERDNDENYEIILKIPKKKSINSRSVAK